MEKCGEILNLLSGLKCLWTHGTCLWVILFFKLHQIPGSRTGLEALKADCKLHVWREMSFGLRRWSLSFLGNDSTQKHIVVAPAWLNHLILSKLVCRIFGLLSLDTDIPVLDLSSKLSHQPVLLFLRDPYVLPKANGNQTCHLLTVLYWSDPAPHKPHYY